MNSLNRNTGHGYEQTVHNKEKQKANKHENHNSSKNHKFKNAIFINYQIRKVFF